MICKYLKRILCRYKNLQPIEERVYLRFVVLSDIHITPSKIVEQERLKSVLKACYHLNKDIDAVVIAGDLTDTGNEEEYKAVKSILDKCIRKNTNLIACMGNHEDDSKDLFTSIMHLKPKDNVKIGGYHFITLSPRYSENKYGGDRYYLDKAWLQEQLKEACDEDEKKPIFVIMHHAIKGTVFGSDEWNTEDFQDVFKDYPQVIHFSGHSHYPLNNPKSIYQKSFTAVNTSTISYFDFPSDIERNIDDKIVNEVCQALLVEVTREDVRIRKLDLINNSYIGEDWTINTAEGTYGYKYTDIRAEKSMKPYFKSKAKIKVKNTGKGSCNIQISCAEVKGHREVIEFYKADFKNMNTNKIDKSYKIWSQYGLIPQPKKITAEFKDLKENTEYEVTVTAFNAYGKSSTSTLKAKFITK